MRLSAHGLSCRAGEHIVNAAEPKQYRVLLTDRAWPDSSIERDVLQSIGAELVEAPNSQPATLADLARDVDAIMTCWAPVTAAVISASERLKVVVRMGIGLDNIDVKEATKRKIPVANVPDYCLSEVSDHALAMLLALARKIAFYNLQAKSGVYKLQSGPTMRRLSRQTLGIVGLGRIGQALVPKAKALELNVIAYTRSGDDHGTGCRMVGFDELLELSDYISLHLPLNPSTSKMFAAEQFARMRNTAYLINTSRGGLIDHDALWRAIESGQVAGAALDVFDPEPPDLSHPLFRDPRVIVTPHAAFTSQESLEDLRERATTQVVQALQGKRPTNLVNPEIDA